MKQILFKNTAQKTGRNIVITPDNSDLKFLSVGRIILNKEISEVQFASDEKEISLICVKGEGTVTIGDTEYNVKPYDTVYIPRDSKVTVKTNSHVDFAECSAPVTHKFEPALVRFEDVKNSDKAHKSLGKETDKRELYDLLGDNVKGARLYNGITFIKPGNWASWPPHQHTNAREEVYLYVNMPKPAFALQLVYDDVNNPEHILPVFENDAVVISSGYHPNVAIPGYEAIFIWMLCAKREIEDRMWGGSIVQPEFL
ncbi:MAG: 5-deoxy-glucuronate isomerase [Melioribacteraceae bacterium]